MKFENLATVLELKMIFYEKDKILIISIELLDIFQVFKNMSWVFEKSHVE